MTQILRSDVELLPYRRSSLVVGMMNVKSGGVETAQPEWARLTRVEEERRALWLFVDVGALGHDPGQDVNY